MLEVSKQTVMAWRYIILMAFCLQHLDDQTRIFSLPISILEKREESLHGDFNDTEMLQITVQKCYVAVHTEENNAAENQMSRLQKSNNL